MIIQKIIEHTSMPFSAKTRKREREREGTAADLRDNDSPAVYSCWAFNLGSWSSHDDDAAASSPFRRPSPSISSRRALSAKKKEKKITLFDTKTVLFTISLERHVSHRAERRRRRSLPEKSFQRTIP